MLTLKWASKFYTKEDSDWLRPAFGDSQESPGKYDSEDVLSNISKLKKSVFVKNPGPRFTLRF